MIPIRDINPTRKFAFVTLIFIIFNAYIYFLQYVLLDDMNEQFFYYRHGVLPKCFVSMFDTERYDEAVQETKANLKKTIAQSVHLQYRMRLNRHELQRLAQQIDQLVEENFSRELFGQRGPFVEIVSLFTSMFLHGSLWHLIGNMWFLWIFGNNIEDDFGILRFLAFYFATGVCASFGHILTNLGSVVPTIGASGAISGVLGAYLMLHPKARILTFIPIGYFLWLEDLPAYVFLGYWIIIQVIFGFLSNPVLGGGGVAWFAHIAGFVAGVLFVIMFDRHRMLREHLPERDVEDYQDD
jgi:membrane associated rhomboid family serine protease